MSFQDEIALLKKSIRILIQPTVHSNTVSIMSHCIGDYVDPEHEPINEIDILHKSYANTPIMKLGKIHNKYIILECFALVGNLEKLVKSCRASRGLLVRNRNMFVTTWINMMVDPRNMLNCIKDLAIESEFGIRNSEYDN